MLDVRRSTFDVQLPHLLLAGSSHGKRIVAACCCASLTAGVREGMSIAHATALLPRSARLILRDHAPAEDSAALARLARWAIRFSPVVATDEPDGLMLDVTGCQRLYGGDERLAALVAGALRRLGLNVRVAIAPTIGSVWALARFAPELNAKTQKPQRERKEEEEDPEQAQQQSSSSGFAPSLPSLRLCVSSGHSWIVVSDEGWPMLFPRLPIAALRVEAKVVDELAEVGIDFIGQLLDVPREEIAARFGHDLLLRIDQATGSAMEVLRPVRQEEPPAVVMRFAGPTTQLEAIQQAVEGLVGKLCTRLLKREAGARRLVLRFERLNEDLKSEFAEETLTLSRPSRDARHLWALLRQRIERLHLGEGIEQLDLTAARTAPLPHEQERLDGSSDESETTTTARLQESAGQLVDLLESRLGPPAVLACEMVETHVPEAAFRYRPASEGAVPLVARHRPPGPERTQSRKVLKVPQRAEEVVEMNALAVGPGAGRITSTIIPPPGDRPTVLFEKPEPAQVTLLQPEGPVIGLQWHRLHRITSAVGPERIGRRWWHFALSRRQLSRDYYRLQDEEGLWLWVYRSRVTRRWFVHGVWG